MILQFAVLFIRMIWGSEELFFHNSLHAIDYTTIHIKGRTWKQLQGAKIPGTKKLGFNVQSCYIEYYQILYSLCVL